MKPFRVLVTGSRSWRSPKDRETLRAALDEILAAHPKLTLIHGGCSRGADFLAHQWAQERVRDGAAITVEVFTADWDRYGHAAGPRRNADMVAAGSDVCLAFVRGASRGASHCAWLAEKSGITVRRWTDA